MRIFNGIQSYYSHIVAQTKKETSQKPFWGLTKAAALFQKIQKFFSQFFQTSKIDRKIIVTQNEPCIPNPCTTSQAVPVPEHAEHVIAKVDQVARVTAAVSSQSHKTQVSTLQPNKTSPDNPLLKQLQHVGHGMHNAGNTCYMASVLHALAEVEAVAKTIWENPESRPKNATPPTQTRNLLKFFHENGWGQNRPLYAQRDAKDFLEYILDKLTISHEIRTWPARRLPTHRLQKPMNVQEFLSEKFTLRHPVDVLAIAVGARAEVTPKNTTPLIPVQELQVPLEAPLAASKEALLCYSLKAVIVYEGEEVKNGHYYTILPKSGTWIEYNDAKVIHHMEYETIQNMLEEHNYIFIYANPKKLL